MLILTRVAALCAMDAPPISYLARMGPAREANVTTEKIQDPRVRLRRSREPRGSCRPQGTSPRSSAWG